uniref:Uncharacterized protein n=1 Tax=Caenorhabditis japonica TaxID=281687 RepID=A0A8R1I9N0_CAEJA
MSVSGTQKSPSEDFIGEKKKPSPEGVDNKKMGSQEKELPVEKKDVATVEKKESSAEKKEPEKKEKEPEKKESEKKDPGAAVPKPPKKRVSSAESADGKKFNMQLAQLFFKTMLEQRKTAKTVNTDALLETMPEPAQMVVSTKVTKLKSAKRRSSTGLNTNLFKSNGEPVWLYHERKPGDFVELEDGVKTRWPELMQALMEDKIKMEDGKQWIPMISDYAAGKFDEGALDEL